MERTSRQQRSVTCHGRKHLRRGSGYLLVLASATLVSVIGLSSLMLVRVQQRTQKAAADTVRAKLYARSAVETAIFYSTVYADWRNLYSSVVSMMPVSFDRGSVSFTITETNGSGLVTSSDNPVLITGTGIIGSTSSPEANCRFSVGAHQPPLNLLGTALHAAGTINVSLGASVTVENGPLSTNGTLVNRGNIAGSVECATLINYGGITGTRTTGATAKPMPASNVFDYYRGQSSTVTLSGSSVGSTMEWVVLSPASNPWQSSATSTDGLYYIKPSSDLTIRNMRIVGTLLVELNSGRKLTLDVALLWEPARPDFPALIVKGNCTICFYNNLTESNWLSFNPPGTPYQGNSDNDRNDSYTSRIQGLVHVVGSGSSLTIENAPLIQGTILAEGSVTINSNPHLAADPNLLLESPTRYRMGQLVLDLGTWQPLNN